MDSKKLPITLYLYNQPISERISNLLESYNELFEKVEVIDTNLLVMAGDDKTSHWNYLACHSETPWVLFLDNNEYFESLASFKALQLLFVIYFCAFYTL